MAQPRVPQARRPWSRLTDLYTALLTSLLKLPALSKCPVEPATLCLGTNPLSIQWAHRNLMNSLGSWARCPSLLLEE